MSSKFKILPLILPVLLLLFPIPSTSQNLDVDELLERLERIEKNISDIQKGKIEEFEKSLSSGYISRNPTVTGTSAPTTTYAESDWINRSTDSCQSPDYYLITHASVSDGTAKTYNGLYIDTIYIDNNSATTMGNSDGYNDTTNGNLLNGIYLLLVI